MSYSRCSTGSRSFRWYTCPRFLPELRETALTAGTRLYNNWRHAVMELTETDSPTAQQTEEPADRRHDQQENGDGIGSDSIHAAG